MNKNRWKRYVEAHFSPFTAPGSDCDCYPLFNMMDGIWGPLCIWGILRGVWGWIFLHACIQSSDKLVCIWVLGTCETGP